MSWKQPSCARRHDIDAPHFHSAFNEREVTVALAKPASVKKKERAEKAAIRKAKKKAERSEKAVEATGSEPVAQASASAGATAVVGEDGEVKKTKKKSKSKVCAV